MAEQQALAQREETAATPIVKELAAVKPYLERLLGPSAPRFGVTLLSLARRNPDLLRCDPTTVVGSALVCAQLELEPGPAEHVWLIPRWNKKTQTNDCTLLIGKNGMKALAERHPLIESVRTGTVFEGDEFDYTTQPPALRHVRRFASEKATRWYAIAYRTDGGAPHIAVLDATAVAERRKHSATPDKGPWVTHFNAMAEKSAIRALWKELPSSLDMTRAEQIDDSSGVVHPKDLLVGRPALIDAQTAEIIETPPPGAGSAASGSLAGGATTISEQDVAAAGPETSQPVEPQATGPGVGDRRDTRPAPPTDDQIAMLRRVAEEFGWDETTTFVRLGVDSWDDAELTFDRALEHLTHWIPKLEDWRVNRRSRLASSAQSRDVDLTALLAERKLPLAGELDARQAQTLIDEIEQLPANQPSREEDASAPAAAPSVEQSPEVRATFDSLMQVTFAGPSARARYRDTMLMRLGVKSEDELTDEQLQSESKSLRSARP